MSAPTFSTYIISSEDEFKDSSVRAAELGLSPTRLDPVYTEISCNGSKGETGCFMAHKSAWQECARNTADYCIILERDWNIGTQSKEHVTKELQENVFPNVEGKDMYLIGHCFGYHCTHAYVVNRRFANEIANVDECAFRVPVDVYLNGKCHDGSALCSRYEKENMPGYFGEGLVQQDRVSMIGMHNSENI